MGRGGGSQGRTGWMGRKEKRQIVLSILKMVQWQRRPTPNQGSQGPKGSNAKGN